MKMFFTKYTDKNSFKNFVFEMAKTELVASPFVMNFKYAKDSGTAIRAAAIP